MARAMTKGPTEFTAPRWAGDFVGHDSIMPFPGKLDPGQFAPEAQVVVGVGAAGAAIGAVTVPVDALSGPIPNNTRLDFGDKGIVTLTEEAPAAAVTIKVEPLVLALVNADEATYSGTELSSVPSGTIVGRTFAERTAGTGFGPAVDTDDEIYITVFDVVDVDEINDVEFYRPGKVVKENYLPAFATLDADLLVIIRTKYLCITGKE